MDRRRSAFALVSAGVGSSAAESSPSGGEGLQSVAAVGEPVVKAAAKHAKLVHLQILRAVAASLVVADHTYGALVYRKVPVAADMPAADLCGSLGVAAFFVLSGLIMMRQSAGRFGSWQGSVLFAYRRVTRIFPMYWIATYLWFHSILTRGVKFDHAKEQVVGSLLFLPNVYSTSYRLTPLLQQGWTLNYEMWFYFLFALVLLLPERAGIGLLVATLFGLVIVGGHVHLGGETARLLLRFYTDWLLLLFAAGMTIGYAEIRWPRLRLLNFPVSPALLLIVPAAVLLALPAKLGEAQYWQEWNILLWIVAAVVVALCALAGSGNLSWIGRLGVLLGDASYSTYLFHLWAFQPLYQKLAPRIARWHLEGCSIPLYVCGFVLTANLLGIFLHLVLERPVAMLFQFLQRKYLQPLLLMTIISTQPFRP